MYISFMEEAKKVKNAVINRLQKYMNEQDLSIYALAKKSKLPPPTVKSIFQKKTKGFDLKTIIILANDLGVTPGEFFNDSSFLVENLDLE